jgi:DNA-binding PadR family transcriptional regulator
MLARLFVLGLLTWRPLSGYEIHFILQQNQTERWAGILPGSIYHALKKLADEGFLVLQATEQVGNRAKAIYAITSAGEDEFRRLLKETWRVPLLHFPSGIYTALGFVDSLPREEVIQALDEQIEQLQLELENWNAGEVIKAQYIPEAMLEYQRALFANGREHLEIDLRFLRYLRETLPSVPRLSLTLPPVPLEEENP